MLEKYEYPLFPKNTTGAVDRNGDFYAFASSEKLASVHNNGFRILTLEVLKRDPIIRFEKLKSNIEHPEYYATNYGEYDFKALAIDFLGLCSFTIYGTELDNYAPIEVPIPKIGGFKITREQQDTLIQLVKINYCSIESLRPIFRHEEYSKEHILIKK